MRPQFLASALLALTTGLAEEHVLKSVAEVRVAVAVNVAVVLKADVALKVAAANTDARVIKLFSIY